MLQDWNDSVRQKQTIFIPLLLFLLYLWSQRVGRGPRIQTWERWMNLGTYLVVYSLQDTVEKSIPSPPKNNAEATFSGDISFILREFPDTFLPGSSYFSLSWRTYIWKPLIVNSTPMNSYPLVRGGPSCHQPSLYWPMRNLWK